MFRTCGSGCRVGDYRDGRSFVGVKERGRPGSVYECEGDVTKEYGTGTGETGHGRWSLLAPKKGRVPRRPVRPEVSRLTPRAYTGSWGRGPEDVPPRVEGLLEGPVLR